MLCSTPSSRSWEDAVRDQAEPSPLPLAAVWLLDGFNVLHASGFGAGAPRVEWWTARHRERVRERVEERESLREGLREPQVDATLLIVER